MKTKKLLLGLAVLALVSTGLLANGLNLNGLGSRAIAMGGAFMGLANDYSAVFWNPAGLTQLRHPQFFLSGTVLVPKGTYAFAPAGVDAKTLGRIYQAGILGYLHPIGDSIVVGLAAYTPSGIGTEWDGVALSPLSGLTAFDWESMFGVFTLSPVLAVKLSEWVSVGATFNVNYALLNTKKPANLGPAGFSQYTEKLHGWAYGATFGIHIRPAPWISIGGTYRTQSTVTLKGTADMPGAALLSLPTSSDASRGATYPMWFGGGVAIKPIPSLTITADAQFTNWKKLQQIDVVYSNVGWETFFAPAGTILLKWENKTQFRFGLEYMVNANWAVRAGYYTDKDPSPDATLNILLPQVTYNAFNIGIGYSNDRIAFDIGMEALFGNKATAPLPPVGVMPGVHGMDIYAPNIAFTYKF